MKLDSSHLSYCTNIHPAETWEATAEVLRSHVLAVRERLLAGGELEDGAPFAIGLRLSAVAAEELLAGERLERFRDWLAETNTYVFTINGFPYGSFHGTRVKEQVFLPDWSDRARLEYTKNLFRILSVISQPGTGASVSTLPGSHKTFHPQEGPILAHLVELALFLDELAREHGRDFHLGLEPEPLGHFENTEETLAFFQRLHASAPEHSEIIRRRIGLNYDACHLALEYDEARDSLDALVAAGIRISKIHLSSALALDPRDTAALEAIREFDEPIYFHQALLRDPEGRIKRYPDLPDFFQALDCGEAAPADFREMRVHFHIPLDTAPEAPLRSTQDQIQQVLAWRRDNPDACNHYEIETYTWGVLPSSMHRPVDEQLAAEYRWVLANA
ncbi:metabolite traffic protein EboE [Luteolibacter sp. SL250]|uniref:metabolite traffic protein EboE n=1 Tax=Luteolibacter sp. SL250 TaxID=2995170 RepID=UPI0022702B25|nr:metabolite traffic protein EboE [Luteolibacter sp. SL250]WAC18205.1 metabolite traffic protein EboE [Luteolibacter sp. SL250]